MRCGGVFSRRTHEQGGGWVGAAAQGDAKRRPASCARWPRGWWVGDAPPAQRPRRGGNVASRSRTMSTQHGAETGWAVDAAISRYAFHRRGGKPRRDGCSHARVAFLTAGDATGVTRRGWAGNRRAALPHRFGREPRGTGCASSADAIRRSLFATGAARRGWLVILALH